VDTGGAPGTTLAQGSFKVTKQYLRYATQLIRELTAVGLHHIGDTGTEGAFNTSQLFKYRIGQVTSNPDGSYQVAYQLVDTGGAPGTTLAQGSFKVIQIPHRWQCALHSAGTA
jgi:hypothetical protein